MCHEVDVLKEDSTSLTSFIILQLHFHGISVSIENANQLGDRTRSLSWEPDSPDLVHVLISSEGCESSGVVQRTDSKPDCRRKSFSKFPPKSLVAK